MSKKTWMIIIGAGVVLILAVVAVGAVIYGVPIYRSAQHLANAKDAVARGDVGEAKRFYREYLYLNPEDPEILESYATLCVEYLENRRQSLTEAGRAYMRLAQLDPENIERRRELATFFRRHQFWDDLESMANQLLAQSPDDMSLHYERAIAIEGLGRTSEAITEFEKYLEALEAPRLDVPLRLARLQRTQERASQAVALLEEELKNRPEDPAVKASYANYLMDDGALEKAAALLPATLDMAQSDWETTQAVIRLRMQQENFEAARDLTAEALTRFPSESELHLNHLLALERLEERDQVLAHIDGLEPATLVDSPGIILFQIEILLAQENAKEADDVREMYLKAYPNQISMDEYLRGRIAFAQEDFEGARERFTMAVEMNPTLHRARYFQVLALMQLKDNEAARVSLEIYLRNNPDDQQARQMLERYFEGNRSILELRVAAQRLLDEEAPALDDLFYTSQELLTNGESDDKDIARELVERALAVDPSDSRGYIVLAGYYLESGETMKAEDILAKASTAGIDMSRLALLEASIALIRSDRESALSIARKTIDPQDTETMKQWATFWARRGFHEAADNLLRSFMGDGEDKAQQEINLFAAELALQFDSPEAALLQLQTAEELLGSLPDYNEPLNRVRIMIARGMLSSESAESSDTVKMLMDKVAESEPGYDGLAILRARMELMKVPANLPQALEYLNQIPEDSIYQDDAALTRAQIQLMRGRYDRAIELAQKVIERAPRNKAAWHLTGDAQMRMGNLEGARISMERVLEFDPSEMSAMRALVGIYGNMQLRRKADAMLARFSDLASADPNLQSVVTGLRATLDLQSGDYSVAEENLRAKLADNPNDYGLVSGLAKVLAARERYDEAIPVMRRYLDSEKPVSPEPWVLLGRLLLDQRDPSVLGDALSAFTQAQSLVPDFAPAQLGNIEVQARLGNEGVAIAMCDRYLAERAAGSTPLIEQDAQVYFQRAVLRSNRESGQTAALADLDSAVAIVEAPRFLSLRALLRRVQGDAAGAIVDLRRVSDLSGFLSVADEVTMAEACLDTGSFEDARHYIQSAYDQRENVAPSIAARIEAVRSGLEKEGVVQQ